MKGLIDKNTKLSEPIGQTTLSGYGICCLGGFMEKGNCTFFPAIGGGIDFNSETLEGNVTLLRYPEIDTGKADFGAWQLRAKTLREATASMISKKLTELEDKDASGKDKISKLMRILNQFNFHAYIQTMNLEAVTTKLYHGGIIKGLVSYTEKYSTMFFGKSGQQLGATGMLDSGLKYFIARPQNTQGGLTRIRLNKGVWMAWRYQVGYKFKESILEWIRLHDTYGSAGDHTIDVKSIVNALLDEISKRPTLATVPNLSSYIADKIIEIGLFNLTVAGLSRDEWYVESSWSMIKENVSDKQVTAMLKIFTEEWTQPQIIIPNSDLPHKFELKVLPFWDGSVFDDKLKEPYLSMIEILFDHTEVGKMTPAQKKAVGGKTTAVAIGVVRLLTINACADGSTNANHIMLNRIIGPISSLSDDGRISQISIDAVYPWIMGLQQPADSLIHLEKRHWNLVFMHSSFDSPPVEAENMREAMLVGLKSFLGPQFYLVKVEDFYLASGAMTMSQLKDSGTKPFNLFELFGATASGE